MAGGFRKYKLGPDTLFGDISPQQQPEAAQGVAAPVEEIQVNRMELATTLDLVSCPTCRLSFDTDYELNEHMLITPECNTGFENGPVQQPVPPAMLIQQSTQSEEKPHQCEQCPKRFNQISQLRKHKITHTSEN